MASLGWDGWTAGGWGINSLHASLGFLTVWQSDGEISYLVAGIPKVKAETASLLTVKSKTSRRVTSARFCWLKPVQLRFKRRERRPQLLGGRVAKVTCGSL